MILKQTNERHTVPIVGRIILENANGKPIASVCYRVSPVLRARELFCEDGVYVYQRQDEQGIHRYRFDRLRSPARPVDECLHDYESIPVPTCPTCGREL